MKMQAISGSKLCAGVLGIIILAAIGILIYLTAGSQNDVNNNVPKSLKMVHVIFRHGDKNPDILTVYPKSPLKNFTYFPYGIGQLTQKGHERAYSLGKILHKLYGNFLGKIMYNGLIDATTSEIGRARMSLTLVLASLFPPSDEQKIIPSLNWQPMIYNTLKNNEDKVLLVKNACPKAFHVSINYTEEDLEFFKFLEENTGYVVKDLRPAYYTSVYLKENKELGLPTPEWAENCWSKIQYLGEIRHWKEVIEYQLPLLAGNLMELILNNTKKALDNQNSEFTTKMFLYSGHYHNIIAVLGSLANYQEEFIEYSSQIILEVHLINQTYGIKAFFQNGVDAKIRPLILPFCAEFCPIGIFEEYQNFNIISKKC